MMVAAKVVILVIVMVMVAKHDGDSGKSNDGKSGVGGKKGGKSCG